MLLEQLGSETANSTLISPHFSPTHIPQWLKMGRLTVPSLVLQLMTPDSAEEPPSPVESNLRLAAPAGTQAGTGSP